jgi:Transglycosylase SLT domain
MFNRPTQATQKADQSAGWTIFMRDTASGFAITAHHTLLVLGVSAIGTLGALFAKPDIAQHLTAFSPFSVAIAQETGVKAPSTYSMNLMDLSSVAYSPQEEIAHNKTTPPSSAVNTAQFSQGNDKTPGLHQQQWVTYWLSKRYRVAMDATNMLVSTTYLTAKEIKLDPLLILAVMAIESGFNPFAESPVGAQGLMQVMAKMHHEKFQELGGVKAALNPLANIKVGSLILKDYVTRGGSIEAGLKLYVGAAAFDNDFGYGSRVLAEYQRLKQVATGKTVPIFTTVTTATASPTMPKLPQSERSNTVKTSMPTGTEPELTNSPEQPGIKEDQIATL